MAKTYNLARMTTATTGTGTITLGSAVTGWLSFANAGVQDGDTITYTIVEGNNREIGRGVYTAAGTTLTRSVLKSTASNTPITLAGNAVVFITAAAEDVNMVGSHRYWGLTDMMPYAANVFAVTLAELVFYEGASVITPSASYANIQYTGAGSPYPLSNAFDSNNTTFWAGEQNCGIMVDFGTARALTKIRIVTRSTAMEQTPTRFNLVCSDDNIFFQHVALINVAGAIGVLPPSIPPASTQYDINLPTYVR